LYLSPWQASWGPSRHGHANLFIKNVRSGNGMPLLLGQRSAAHDGYGCFFFADGSHKIRSSSQHRRVWLVIVCISDLVFVKYGAGSLRLAARIA